MTERSETERAELVRVADDLDNFVHDMREDGNDASALWLEQRASALRRIAAADSNASAEARLREVLRPFSEYCPTSIMREDDSWVLRIPHNARQPMFADFDKARKALSPDPHASDCEKQGWLARDVEAATKRVAEWKDSDRPADVTVDEIADIIDGLGAIMVTPISEEAYKIARALLDAFTVGRR